jgi:RNA polymerase sigma-70 factor, ECF subfamily
MIFLLYFNVAYFYVKNITMTNSKIKLSQLMLESQNGNSISYKKLLESISSQFRKYLAKRIFNQEDIEDVLQDILISIHHARHTYLPERPFEPWAYGIARNVLFKYYSKSKKLNQEFLTSEIELYETTKTEVIEDRRIGLLKEKLKLLSARQRNIIELLKFKGMSIEAVSKETGLSISNVKVIAHRSYIKLREELNNENR